MAPSTRSQHATTSRVKLEDVNGDTEETGQVEGQHIAQKVDTGISAMEGFMSQLQKTVRNLKRDVTTLQKHNSELQDDLNGAREAAENQFQPKRGARGGPTTKQLQAKVNALRRQVNDLEQKRERDRRKIAKLRAKEIRKDAEDLQDQADFEIGDNADQMRKLLRRFHDIMLSNSIADDEECAICMTQMEVGNALSYSCEHTFCKDCTKQLAPGYEDFVSCPACRKDIPKEDMEVVEFTASQQWDALLEVAKRWAKIDRRRELETSDEEAEERFIDDDNGISDARTASPAAETENSEPADASSPPPTPGNRRLKRRAPLRAPSVASSVPGEQEIELQEPESQLEQEGVNGDNRDQEAAEAERANQAEESQGTDGRISTPAPESGTSQADAERPSTPGYSQSPSNEKKRRLQELAEKRSKKRRL